MPGAELGLGVPHWMEVWLGREVVLGATPRNQVPLSGSLSLTQLIWFLNPDPVGDLSECEGDLGSFPPQVFVGLEQFHCGFLQAGV